MVRSPTFAIGALRGWADGVLDSADGTVTAEEAQEYVAQALRAAQIRDQRPVLDAKAANQWMLSSGNLEAGPDLASLSNRPAVAPSANSDFAAEMAQLQAMQAKEKELLKKQDDAVAAARADVLAEATSSVEIGEGDR